MGDVIKGDHKRLRIRLYPIVFIVVGTVFIYACSEVVLTADEQNQSQEMPYNAVIQVDQDFFDLSDPRYVIQTSFQKNAGPMELHSKYVESGCTNDCGPSLAFIIYDIVDRPLSSLVVEEVVRLGTFDYLQIQDQMSRWVIQYRALIADSSETGLLEVCWLDPLNRQTCGTEILFDSSSAPDVMLLSYDDGTALEYRYKSDPSPGQSPVVSGTSLSTPSFCISKEGANTFAVTLAVGEDLEEVNWAIASDGSELMDISMNFSVSDPGGDFSFTMVDLHGPPTHIIEVKLSVDPAAFSGTKCIEGFAAEFLELPHSLTDKLGKVEMIYTQRDGTMFRTSTSNNQNNQFFKVERVADFETDPNGFPTKILTVQFSAGASTINGDEVQLYSDNFDLIISYPGS